MTDDSRLAIEAKALLNNVAFQHLVQRMTEKYFRDWADAPQPQDREFIYQRVGVAREIVAELTEQAELLAGDSIDE